ncbi:MFS general substrate transporter [Stipitochalara longipes BDJ]|nr:MFS general substrate transporter [Stipitochalara longipes BDJ]
MDTSTGHEKLPSMASISMGGHIVPDTAPWKPLKQEYLVMLTISILSLMVALDATILVPVLPALATALHGTSSDAFWAGTSYLLTSAVFQPFIAALSDVFGRQQLLLLSLIFFSAGALICAFANGFTILLVGRSIQGIGGGGIITLGQVIFSDIVPLRQRPKYFSFVLGAWAIGTILGPVIGGTFVEKLNWRWVFYLNFPFCIAGLIMIILFVKINTTVKESLKQKIQRVDWLGSFLFIGGTTSFLIGVSWGGIQYKWTSASTLAPILVGLFGIILSCVSETRVKEPVLRGSLFYNASAVAAYFCAFAQGFLLFTALYYFPFYFMSVRNTGPIQSGINIFPVLFLLLPGSIVVSAITTRIGRFRWAIWSGWLITTVGCGLLALLNLHTKTAVWAGVFVVFGVGSGMLLSSVNFGIQAISKSEDCGRAACMYSFVRSMGMSIGVAVSSTIFQNVMSSKLTSLGLPTSISHSSEGFVAVMKTMAADDPVRVGALKAYVQGFHGVFIAMACVSGTALLASLFIKTFSMDRSLESEFKLEARVVSDSDPELGASSRRDWGSGSGASVSGSSVNEGKDISVAVHTTS